MSTSDNSSGNGAVDRSNVVQASNGTSHPALESKGDGSAGNGEFTTIALNTESIGRTPPIIQTNQIKARTSVTKGFINYILFYALKIWVQIRVYLIKARTSVTKGFINYILFYALKIWVQILVYLRGARDAITEGDLRNLQKVGLKIVKYLVMPTSLVALPNAMTVSVNFFQVYAANSTFAASTKGNLLKPSFAAAMVTITLGTILFWLSTSQDNFRGKVVSLKMAIMLTFASVIVELALFFAAGWQFVSLV